jgi:hypothetical protein
MLTIAKKLLCPDLHTPHLYPNVFFTYKPTMAFPQKNFDCPIDGQIDKNKLSKWYKTFLLQQSVRPSGTG